MKWATIGGVKMGDGYYYRFALGQNPKDDSVSREGERLVLIRCLNGSGAEATIIKAQELRTTLTKAGLL